MVDHASAGRHLDLEVEALDVGQGAADCGLSCLVDVVRTARRAPGQARPAPTPTLHPGLALRHAPAVNPNPPMPTPLTHIPSPPCNLAQCAADAWRGAAAILTRGTAPSAR